MALERLSNWFLTSTGKKAAYLGAGAASTASLLINFLPNTVFLDKYKDFLHLYRKGFTVPLTKTLQERFQKALELAEIDEKERSLYKPFAATGFDIVSAGSSFSHYGVIVGLPANFMYEKEEDIDRHRIRIRDDSVTWDTEDGQRLSKSLVLSENAQLYAMAREIKMRGTFKLGLDILYGVVSITGAYGLGNYLNKRFDLYVKPRPLRLIMYTLVGAFSYGSYSLCKDYTQIQYERKIDKELKEKNQIFMEGGKEFYTKLLERNKALRKFLGREGERAYSVLGNENYLFRYKHTPLVQRKAFFEEQ